MAWTAPKTWTIGDTVTAAEMNTYVRDNLDYLKGNAGTVVLAGPLNLGANELTINSVEIVGADGEVNAAAIEDVYLRKDTDDTLTGNFSGTAGDRWCLSTPANNDDYYNIQARDNGVGYVTVARVAANASPRFSQAVITYYGESDLTIDGSDTIALTGNGYVRVIVNGGTGNGADDLDLMTGYESAYLVCLSPKTSGVNDTVTVKYAIGGNGSFNLAGDFAMNHVDDRLMVIKGPGNEWYELSRSSNA